MSSFVTWLIDSRLVKGPVYALVGILTWPRLNVVNTMHISGMKHLDGLPKRNVLFVSNHQTYFADVMAFMHIFFAHSWGRKESLGLPWYLLWPFTRVKFVAAEETMKNSIVSRMLALAGAVTIKRTWRSKGHEVERPRDENDTSKIDKALRENWLITFPQGTTKPFAPGRKGTAHIIKHNKPIVVPIVINGFWRAFDKKGLKYKKRGSLLSITIKEPLQINYDASTEVILEQVMNAIEQSRQFMLKGKHHVVKIADK